MKKTAPRATVKRGPGRPRPAEAATARRIVAARALRLVLSEGLAPAVGREVGVGAAAARTAIAAVATELEGATVTEDVARARAGEPEGEKQLVAMLREAAAKGDLENVAAVGVRLAAGRYAEQPGSATAADSFKKSLEELRRASASHLELAQKKGELIPRDVAKAVVGQLARRAILALDRVVTGVGLQVLAWRDSPEFRALEGDELQRRARAWTEEQVRSARVTEAEEVERMVANEVAEQASGGAG